MVSLDGEIELFTADGRRVASRKLGARNQANDILYRPDGLQLACTFGSTVFLLDELRSMLATSWILRAGLRSAIALTAAV